MAERRVFGRSASTGLAAGPVVVLDEPAMPMRTAGTPEDESRALCIAIAASLAEARAHADRAEGEAADMLAFQVEMLADDELARPALEAIAAGTPAHSAWVTAMTDEIAGYRSSEDPYFAARAVDLQDIQDRVLSQLGPGHRPASRTIVQRGAVVVASDLTLSRFLAIDWASGGAIVLTQGSPSGHVAMLARSRGVPMVVGVGGLPGSLAAGEALVDADSGEVVLDPGEAAHHAYLTRRAGAAAESAGLSAWLDREALTADGTRIALHLNVADVTDLDGLDPRCCDGIGLVRTELLFQGLADEQTQYRVYRRIAEWADGRPVTIRTLDAGADKPLPGLTTALESNPFLGLRGVRLSLRHHGIFRIQLRALARAAVHGAVRIMLPMVTIPQELEAARAILDAAIADLATEGIPARRGPLGIMVEVPAAAIAIDRFSADFFSIGSNDLTQYVTAAARDIGSVADLADPLNPAVLRLIASVAEFGRAAGREVSLCGDAGADPAVVTHLLHAGLRSLSVAPTALARAKRAIAATDLGRTPS